MTMPKNLLIVRHGQSEGNVAVERSRKGDHSDYAEEFRNRHSSKWRLSNLGREQAVEAGRWISKNFHEKFHRFCVSEYLRALETAALLQIPGAVWHTDFHLRERNWGDLDSLTVPERESLYGDSMKRRKIDPFYWDPPNGKSIADLCLWIDRILDTLHRECSGKNVVIVCHGEVMWAFRVRLERISHDRFLELDRSKDDKDRIHNCQILHYTRQPPQVLNEDLSEIPSLAPYLGWMRSVCPWDMSLSNNAWEEIHRPRFTNDELLARVEETPRLVE